MTIRRLGVIILIAFALAGCVGGQRGSNDAKDSGAADALDIMKAGTAAQQRGENDQALELLSHAIDAGTLSDYNMSAAHFDRGLVYLNKAQYERAIAEFTSAIRFNAGNTGAYMQRSLAYERSGQPDLAISDLDIVIRLKPDYPTAYNNRGNLYARKGQRDHAIADYDEAIRLRPDYPEAYYSRGLSYNQLAQFDRAIADHDQAIHLKPDYAEAYIGRGYSHSLKGEHDTALRDFAAAIKLRPNAVYAYYDRALTELVLGQYDHAAEDLRRAVELDSSSAYLVAWLHVARAKSSVDDRDEFARNAARVDHTRWPSPVLALYLGRATPEQLQAAAGYNEPKIAEDRDCFAAIQIGEYDLMQKDAAAAKAALQHAAVACPTILLVRAIALAELRRMGQ